MSFLALPPFNSRVAYDAVWGVQPLPPSGTGRGVRPGSRRQCEILGAGACGAAAGGCARRATWAHLAATAEGTRHARVTVCDRAPRNCVLCMSA